MSAWAKIRAVLGALTDLLNIGRARGWWTEKPGIIAYLNSR